MTTDVLDRLVQITGLPPSDLRDVMLSVIREECIEWTGYISKTGYGYRSYKGQMTTAHRVAYIEAYGPIPEGLHIDHAMCQNRRCVNPEHLEAVTQAENNRRAKALQTHCKHGHLYDEANTYRNTYGYRVCRICRHETVRRYEARRSIYRRYRTIERKQAAQ